MIIVEQRGDCSVIIIPQNPLWDLIQRHVQRVDLHAGTTTCFVRNDVPFDKVPIINDILLLLRQFVRRTKVVEGEKRYAIQHKDVPVITLRDFDGKGIPATGTFYGDFVVTALKYEGGARAAALRIEEYGKHSAMDVAELNKVFAALGDDCGKTYFFVVKHIHPSKHRGWFG